jgi:EPS-associated MarR family transcriptional regulator
VLSSTSVSDLTLLRLLRLLTSRPQLTQRSMADEMGVSVGKANYCLRALVAKGFVKVRNFHNSAHKRSYAYLLTPAGIAAKADLARRFLELKRQEYDALRLEIERLQRESSES